MAWFLQTPDDASPKLLENIVRECGPASKGAAAFAFASAMGVKLLTAEPEFQKFLNASEFVAVIGLDGITDTKAVEELQKVRDKYPNFKPKLFLHGTAGSCFHPKTMWLKTIKGGIIITGSGNLTLGGLKANWESMAVEKLNTAEMNAAEAGWDAWLEVHEKQLFDLDDPTALEKANTNKSQRAIMKKALKLPEEENDAEIQAGAMEDGAEEYAEKQFFNPVLIAEVPKNRPGQVDVGVDAYEQFFGVTLGTFKAVRFYHVQRGGTLVAEKERNAVAVKSHNYRFKVGALSGLHYPQMGHPILIFEKVTDSTFHYILLMPEHAEHELIQKFLDDRYTGARIKIKRIRITAGDLQIFWPASPLFL